MFGRKHGTTAGWLKQYTSVSLDVEGGIQNENN